jgi:hypothetical protein
MATPTRIVFNEEELSIHGIEGDVRASLDEDSKTLTIDVADLKDANVHMITGGNAVTIEPGHSVSKDFQSGQENVIETSVTDETYYIGDVLPEGWGKHTGWIVGPVSPTSGETMLIAPPSKRSQNYQTWKKGERDAKNLLREGFENARQPDTEELFAIFSGVVKEKLNKHAKIVKRDDPQTHAYARYWSSSSMSTDENQAEVQHMDGYGGLRTTRNKKTPDSLSLPVCDAPPELNVGM